MEKELEIDFSHGGIEKVPHLIYPNATKLILRRNRIKSLPETSDLYSLPCLTMLDLYDNLLSIIPSCIIKLAQLKFLDLSFNLIEQVPKHCLPSGLQNLYLTANRLAEIPHDCLQCLHQLRVLELGANRIKSLPANNLSFELLEELWLSGNQIDNDRKLDFSHLPNLKILSLQCNKLSGAISISQSSLILPDSVEELHLGENKISQFDINMNNRVPALPKLRILDLGHNEMVSICESIINNCPMLKDFWINDNKICNLEQTLRVVQNVKCLSALFLARNPCTISLSTYQVKIRLACPNLHELDGLPVQ